DPSVLLSRVDLSVAVLVQQLQVVERVLPAITAPIPMVDVPDLLFHLQRLPARHTFASLPLAKVFDPATPRKRPTQLPGPPCFQVRFPRRVVRIGFTPYLPPPSCPDTGRLHQPDRPALALAVTDHSGEYPGAVARGLEVFLLDPLPTLTAVPFPTPAA